jgi:hypothetical protein
MNRSKIRSVVLGVASCSGVAALIACGSSSEKGATGFGHGSSSGGAASSSGSSSTTKSSSGSIQEPLDSGVIQGSITPQSNPSDAGAPSGDGGTGQPEVCVDAGDGGQRCTCIKIASIGNWGVTGGSQTGSQGDTSAFADWLNTASSASVDVYKTKPNLTPDFLKNYDVLIIQWLADISCTTAGGGGAGGRGGGGAGGCNAQSYWQFSTQEVSDLQAWVKGGGGIVSMSGYEPGSAEVAPVNQLLSFTEMQYGTADVLGTCQLFDGGVDTLCTCNAGAVPLGPPWNNTPIGQNITSVGAYLGRPIVVNGADAVVDIQDSKYVYAAHQTIGTGHVFVYTDEWVTYTSQWVSNDAGAAGINYTDPNGQCYGRASGEIFQVPQFWYNSIGWAASSVNCAFTITPPPNQTIVR